MNLSELSVIISNVSMEATFDLTTGTLSSPTKQETSTSEWAAGERSQRLSCCPKLT